jgi:hypothetical protein
MGLAMGVNNLVDIDEKILSSFKEESRSFGKLFFRDMKVFLYPMLDENGDITTRKSKSTS